MARKRNYQWTAATRFEGSITQDKVGGSTQSVTPEVLEARLIEDGFVLDTDLPAPSSAAPQNLGTTNSGSSNDYSRADHRHKMPTLTDIGAVALGETSATAYRGDRGVIAYNHSQATGNPHATTPSDIGAAPLAGAEVLIHSDFGRSATTDVWQSTFTDNTAAGLQLAANSTASGTCIAIEQDVVIPGDASGATYQFYIGPQLTGEGAPSGSTYAIVFDPNEAGGHGQGIVRIKCELIGSGSSITGYVTSTFFNNSGYPPTVKVGTITVNGTIANSIDVRFNPQSVTSYIIRRNRVRRCNP